MATPRKKSSRIAATVNVPVPKVIRPWVLCAQGRITFRRYIFSLPSMCGDEQTVRMSLGNLASLHVHPGMSNSKELNMNKDQVNGKLQDIGGKIQEEAGKLVGNTDQQVKGLSNQVEGKTQEKVGDLKEAAKDALN